MEGVGKGLGFAEASVQGLGSKGFRVHVTVLGESWGLMK